MYYCGNVFMGVYKGQVTINYKKICLNNTVVQLQINSEQLSVITAKKPIYYFQYKN